MRCRQGLAHVAEDQPARRRHAIGMGGDLAFANIDVASRKQRAQVIVGAAVAKAELKHRAIQPGDQRGGMVEAGALRFEPADKAVEPAQGGKAPKRTAAVPAACAGETPAIRILPTSLSQRYALGPSLSALQRGEGIWSPRWHMHLRLSGGGGVSPGALAQPAHL